MSGILDTCIWLIVGGLLIRFAISITEQEELREHRKALIFSLLLMELFVWVAVRVNSMVGVVLLGIVMGLTVRIWTSAVGHVASQKVADHMTDIIYSTGQPAPPSVDDRLVKTMRREGRPKDAIEYLRGILELTPDDFEARYWLATVYAEDLHNLAAAEREVATIAGYSTIGPGSKEMARQRLATWKATPLSQLGPPKVVKKIQEPYQPPTGPNAAVPDDMPPPLPTAAVEEIMEVSHPSVELLFTQGKYGSAVQMLETILAANPADLVGWAIKARIYVQYLKQPDMADKALRHIFGANDFQPHEVQAMELLAEAFAKSKDDSMKAGRLLRKLLEAPSVSLEQKIVIQARLKQWSASTSNG